MNPSLASYSYCAPVESWQQYQKILRFLKRQNISPTQVAWICLREETKALLTLKAIRGGVHSLSDFSLTRESIARANQIITHQEDLFTVAARQSDFLWAILFQFHSQYLLHLHVCLTVSGALTGVLPRQLTWLLIPAGWLWGSNGDQYGDRNPVFYLVLREQLRQQNLRFITVNGWIFRPSFFQIVLLTKFLINILGFFLVAVVNHLLGISHQLIDWPRSRLIQPSVVAFFKEPFSFTSVSDAESAFRRAHVSLRHVYLENLRLPPRHQFLSHLYSVARSVRRIIWWSPNSFHIGRLDVRSWLSQVFFIYWYGAYARRRDYWQLITGISHHWRVTREATAQIFWQDSRDFPALQRYTALVLANFIPEYWYAKIALQSITKRFRPRLLLYPDGYSILVRLAQVQSGLKTIQVPHGYPNRTFPKHYYRAQHYIITTRISDIHLRQLAKYPQATVWAYHDELHTLRTTPRYGSAGPPTIGIIYSGIYFAWSFPNSFDQLLTITSDLLRGIREKIPAAHIVLKSHPNGTSREFFDAIRLMFPKEFDTHIITHIQRAWSKPAEYQRLTLAICPVFFPSTPTIHLLALGIPLLLVKGKGLPEDLLYYPQLANMPDYPLVMLSAGQAVAQAQTLIANPGQLLASGQAMKAYAQLCATPTIGEALPLPTLLLKLMSSPTLR